MCGEGVLYLYISDEVIKPKRESNKAVPTEECKPPDYVFPSEEQPISLEALFPKSVAPKVSRIRRKIMAPCNVVI